MKVELRDRDQRHQSVEEEIERGLLLTTVEEMRNRACSSSMGPATFGLACCASEMRATAASRFDLARFGAEVVARGTDSVGGGRERHGATRKKGITDHD